MEEMDLINLSEEALRIVKNGIYARHGRRFYDSELQGYFDQLSWYQGTIEPEQFTDERLNEFEQENIRLICEVQNKRG